MGGVFGFIFYPSKALAISNIFSEDFSSYASTSNAAPTWLPNSGSWIVGSGQYKQKEIGNSYSIAQSTLFNDDFSTTNHTIGSTLFSDSFTNLDNWTIRRGTFATSSDTLLSNGSGERSLATLTDSSYENWTNYRITTRVKRMGAADAAGYSIIYFRLTMVDSTHENGYALLIRQTGIADLFVRNNGAFGSVLGSFNVSKDNDWHDVIITVVNDNIKIWFDKTESQSPNLSVFNSSYSQGSAGLGTYGWSSYFDDFAIQEISSSRWLDKSGGSYINNGEYNLNTSTIAILGDSSYNNWSNYKVSARIKQLGAVDGNGSVRIFFHMNMTDATHYNSYAFIFYQNGTCYLHKYTNGSSVSSLYAFAIPKDNDWHDVIITVVGTDIKIWFDKAEDQFQDFGYSAFTDYSTGTVAINAVNAGSVFDDIQIQNKLSIDTAPSHLYANTSTSTITVSSSVDLDDLSLTMTNPVGTSWNLTPAGSAGQKSVSVVFPTDFSGANTSVVGTYILTVTNGSDTSVVPLEVKERPLYSFIHITDTHVSTSSTGINYYLQKAISDINNQKDFPLPNFMVLTGDVTESGDADSLAQLKNMLDELSCDYYPLVAGHDTNSESGSEKGHNWANVFGADKFTYSWTLGDFLFLGIDNLAPYGGYGIDDNSSEKKVWLQDILNANPTKNVFVFTHIGYVAPRDSGDAQNYWAGSSASSEMNSILQSHGHVVAQFAGHSHTNFESQSDNIYYIHTAGFNAAQEYRYVEIYSDRIESHMLMEGYTTGVPYWYYPVAATDSTHDQYTYAFGLPFERQFRASYTGGNDDILDAVSVVGNPNWLDYTYQADIFLGYDQLAYGPYIGSVEPLQGLTFKGENQAGLVFRYQDSDNYYSVVLDSAGDIIKLQEKQSGVTSDIATTSATIDLNTTYQLKITAQGTSIKVYLDDVLKIDTTDSTFASGKIGLHTYRASTNYDNIAVSGLGNTGGIYAGRTNTIYPNGSITYSSYPIDDISINNFSITPSAGTVNVSIDTWNTTSTYYKKWTESAASSTIITAHTISDLRANQYYQVKADDTIIETLQANGSGEISFGTPAKYVKNGCHGIQ